MPLPPQAEGEFWFGGHVEVASDQLGFEVEFDPGLVDSVAPEVSPSSSTLENSGRSRPRTPRIQPTG